MKKLSSLISLKKLFSFYLVFLFNSALISQPNLNPYEYIQKLKLTTDSLAHGFKVIPKYKDALGEKIAYFDKNSKLRLIKVISIDSNITKQVSWYVYEDKIYYAETNWTSNNVQVFNEKYYFSLQDGVLLKWITSSGNEVSKELPAFVSLSNTSYESNSKIVKDVLR